jgi:S1-C subfamily serine protease
MRHARLTVVPALTCCLCVAVFHPIAADDPLPPAIARAFESVVSVHVRELVKVPVFRGGRFRREQVEGVGAGSGVVVSAEGLILTNAHVVAGATEVRVGFPGGREADAQVIALDLASDLALLRADGDGFQPIRFAGPELPAAGAGAFVLGNRGDLGPEVAWARIGEHRRVRVGARPLEFWCEVDAHIGPGNSGGAVLDAGGALVGIPSLQVLYAGESRSSAAHMAGLFVPASHARRSLRKMLEGPRPVWPWIGLLLDDSLMAASEGRVWSDDAGARVRYVFPGSPADAAGFRSGDRILSVGEREARDNFEALDAILDLAPGQAVDVAIERAGSRSSIAVETSVRPEDPRPEPIDDFTLHTGLRLGTRRAAAPGRPTLALAGLSPRMRSGLTQFEERLFAEGLVLDSILPGRKVLAGKTGRVPVISPRDLAAVISDCFVEEQFVALIHWSSDGRGTLDRAHVHRKIYPVVL